MHSAHPHFQAVERIQSRVEALLCQLTLDEKIALLGGDPKNGQTLAVERLGIPHFRMADGPVGIHWWCEKSTAYPASITLASSWDRDLSYRLGKSLGRDCRARGVHILLAPGVNIYRSALCGRNFEYLGEDPVLAGGLVAQEIRGVQDQGVAATVKHYALNNQEYDRHAISSDADERTIREVYLPAFEAAIKEGGAAALMTGYNLVNGVHCSQHEWLIKTVLRQEWGFQGVVMSDWVSVYSTVGAIQGGLDLEMPTAKLLTAERIQTALANGLITEEAITGHVRRILTLGAAFGWLDHPQKDDAIPWDDPASSATALDISRAGMVLLKNENQLLPLDAGKIHKIVVLGHHAGQSITCGGGSAYTPPYHTTTLLEGLKSVAPQVEFAYFPAVDLDGSKGAFESTEFQSSNGKPGLQGEYFNNNTAGGGPIQTRQDERINFSWEMANDTFKSISPEINQHNFSVRWSGTFTPKQNGSHVFCLLAHDGS
ncbi:MAG TPA: glycoside hydrolase family 3 N-terminal domain-containing protein, partial [Candidatus Methylacidiphilales bacterium]